MTETVYTKLHVVTESGYARTRSGTANRRGQKCAAYEMTISNLISVEDDYHVVALYTPETTGDGILG